MDANEPGQPDPGPAGGRPLITHDLPTPTSALAIGAHPDDVEFGCGATLAKWAADGCVVHHLVLTDGSKGTWNPDADIERLRVTRQREQRDAAHRLAGDRAGEVVFLGQIDGELDSTLALRGEVARVIRTLRPQVVLGHDPWKRYRLHPDHRHAGLLACDGVVAARDPHFFKEQGLPHHRPAALLLWEADEPNHVEDVTGWVDLKLHALEAHESQFESTMKAVEPEQMAAFRDRIRTRLAGLGSRYDVITDAADGMASAEVFALITDL
jgi:LmbE family N-acetylglucosaminyl deacetylase